MLECVAMLEERDLVLEVPVVFPRHFDDVSLLAERFPRLRIVIDHLGKPPLGRPEMTRWATDLGARRTSKRARQGLRAQHGACPSRLGHPDLQPFVEVALDCFGPSG